MSSSLDQLKATGTIVVCDTGDINAIKQYSPQDATTNPSLILAAAHKPEYAHLIDVAIDYARSECESSEGEIETAFDRLLVEFGRQILNEIPGKVSTEVDARYSFDTQASVNKARRLIKLYERIGVDKSRILIKLASTWEGIKAAQILQQEGINCNLTLMFSLVQAVAAAEARVFLISPFVGRIMDWHKGKTGRQYSGCDDPGVISVKTIYQYYKRYGHETIVMGASFRNIEEIIALAGCDYLTISPSLLSQLSKSDGKIEKQLSVHDCTAADIPRLSFIDEEAKFRFEFNEDAMAVEKLREGISKFSADAVTLEGVLKARMSVLQVLDGIVSRYLIQICATQVFERSSGCGNKVRPLEMTQVDGKDPPFRCRTDEIDHVPDLQHQEAANAHPASFVNRPSLHHLRPTPTQCDQHAASTAAGSSGDKTALSPPQQALIGNEKHTSIRSDRLSQSIPY